MSLARLGFGMLALGTLAIGTLGFEATGWCADSTESTPASPSTAAGIQAATASDAPAIAQLAKKGRELYSQNCAACHQAAGQGVPGVFPPLAGSSFTNGNAAVHIRIAVQGKSGPITVLGTPYNMSMPPFGHLSDEDLAAILTYERTSWGNKGGGVTAEEVKAQR